MKYSPYISPFVWSFSPEPLVQIFCFLHKFRMSFNLKSEGAWFFQKKSCSEVFVSEGAQNEFFECALNRCIEFF